MNMNMRSIKISLKYFLRTFVLGVSSMITLIACQQSNKPNKFMSQESVPSAKQNAVLGSEEDNAFKISDHNQTVSGVPTVTYATVYPIFSNICSACHNSTSWLPNWLDPAVAQKYARNGRMMDMVVVSKQMPPSWSKQASEMTDTDRDLIRQWITAGAPLAAEE